MMADKIFITNFIVPCLIGITEKERSGKQGVIFDIEVFCNLRVAGISDDPDKTLSYSEIREKIFDFVSKGEFKLLESAAEGIASLLLENAVVTKVNIRVSKKKYAKGPHIGIEITRINHS